MQQVQLRRAFALVIIGMLASLYCTLARADSRNNANWLTEHANWRVGVVLQAPYAQLNPHTHLLEGADVEVMLLLAERTGVQMRWTMYNSQQALDRAVEKGEIDVSPGMLQTPSSLHH